MSGTFQPLSPGSQTIAQGNAGVMPTGFGYYPSEGSRVVTCQYNWQGQTIFTEDLSQLEAKGILTSIQSVFVDNSQAAESIVLTVQGTGQIVVCPGTSQGIFPLFVTGAAGFTIQGSSSGVPAVSLPTQVTRVYLLNVPANSWGIWPAPAFGATSQQSIAAPSICTKNITGTITLRGGTVAGRLFKIIVVATTAIGTITISDGPETPGNTILIIPSGTTAGTVYDLNAPYISGLIVTYDGGATGTLTATYGP